MSKLIIRIDEFADTIRKLSNRENISCNEIVKQLPSDHSPQDRSNALMLSGSTDPIYLGLFLKEEIPTFDDHVQQVKDELKQKT